MLTKITFQPYIWVWILFSIIKADHGCFIDEFVRTEYILKRMKWKFGGAWSMQRLTIPVSDPVQSWAATLRRDKWILNKKTCLKPSSGARRLSELLLGGDSKHRRSRLHTKGPNWCLGSVMWIQTTTEHVSSNMTNLSFTSSVFPRLLQQLSQSRSALFLRLSDIKSFQKYILYIIF